MDIVDAIDQATGCQQCGGPLGGSPSDYFCGPACQDRWHAARTEPLTGYREAGVLNASGMQILDPTYTPREWTNDEATQWGLNYIHSRYGSPSAVAEWLATPQRECCTRRSVQTTGTRSVPYEVGE